MASGHRLAQKQWEAEGNACGYECISEGTEAEGECMLEPSSWSHFACSCAPMKESQPLMGLVVLLGESN